MNTLATVPAGAQAITLPPPSRWRLVWRLLVGAGVIGILAWSWIWAEVRPLTLWQYRANIGKMASDFYPVDFHSWRFYATEMGVTIAIAVWGTVLAIIAAVPLGLLASANISPWWIRQPVRRVLDCLRAINEMVFALLFITTVGLGPFAGVLALFVHTTGILGKLFSEVVEAVDPRPVEGIRATGANALGEIAYGVVPQVWPMWISYALYRFESNVRSASVVGMVGAGGIGMVMHDALSSFMYAKAGAILVIVVVTVMILDVISAQIRKHTL
mgnify:CR=1 FL=1